MEHLNGPFSRDALIEELARFLSRKDIQQSLAASIREQDHKILTGVALLAEPTVQELWQFFAGDFRYLEFHELLLNLEKRFILYRFPQEGLRHLALNPLLEPIVRPFIADTNPLFPSMPWDQGFSAAQGPKVDDRVFAGLVAFVLEEDYVRAHKGIRKKALHTLDHLFPGLNAPSLIAALRGLGLVQSPEAGEYDPGRRMEGRFRAFERLSFRERLIYSAAGFYCFRAFPDQELSQTQVHQWALFIHCFLSLLEPSRQYPTLSLRRFGELVLRAGVGSEAGRDRAYKLELLLEALELLGLLEPAAPGYRRLGDTGAGSSKTAGPVLVMDSPCSFVLYPEISFADALGLARFSVPRHQSAGTVAVPFALTQFSVIRGFDQGIDAKAMLDLLKRLSGNRVDPNLTWTLQDWQHRYTEVSLYTGVVLTLAADQRYLAETGPVASLIRRVLAPGVYLLSVPERSLAEEALRRGGVDIIAQPEGPQKYPGAPGKAEERGEVPVYPALDCVPFPLLFPVGQPSSAREVPAAARTRIHAQPDLPLILEEAQGLDYVGKARIVKQAIASKSLLEVLWPHPQGGSKHTLGIPQALERRGSEGVLLIKPLFPDASPEAEVVLSAEARPRRAKALKEPLCLPLSTIGLLRRIKPSFFGE